MSKFMRTRKPRVNRSGRESVGKREEPAAFHVRLHDWLIMSPRWEACTPMARAALLEFMSCDWGDNNGRIAMGRRELANRLGGRGIATADRAIACLLKNGLLVLTREGSKGPKGERATEFLLPFRKDHREGAKPTPVTSEWNKASKHNRNFAKLEVATMRTPAWRALAPQSRLLLLAMISKSKRRNPVKMSNDEAGKAVGASDDTARRAINELQAKGFIELRVDGRALIGLRITAVYDIDLLPVEAGDRPIPVPRARYRLWTPGSDFPVHAAQKKNSASNLMGLSLTSGTRGDPLGLTSGTRHSGLGQKSASPAEHSYVPICPVDAGEGDGQGAAAEKFETGATIAGLQRSVTPASTADPITLPFHREDRVTAAAPNDDAIDLSLDGGVHQHHRLSPTAPLEEHVRREARRVLHDHLPAFLPEWAYGRLRNIALPDVEQAIRIEAKGQLRPRAIRAAGERVLTRLIAIGQDRNHPDPCSAFVAGTERLLFKSAGGRGASASGLNGIGCPLPEPPRVAGSDHAVLQLGW